MRWIVTAFTFLCLVWNLPVSAQTDDAGAVGFPLPELQLITLDNVAELQQVGRIGRGRIYDTFAADEGRMFVASSIGGWEIYRDSVRTLFETANPMTAVTYRDDGEMVAWGDDKGDVFLHSIESTENTTRLEGHVYPITALAVSPYGQLASGDTSGVLRLWTIHRYGNGDVTAQEAWVTQRDTAVSGLAFGRDRLIVEYSTSRPRSIVYDPYIGAVDEGWFGFFHEISDLQLLLTDRIVATVDGARLTWCLEDGTITSVDTIDQPSTPEHHVQTFNSSGSRRAEADDSVIRLYDIATDALITTYYGHFRGVTALTFSPDGSLLFSSSLDRTMNLWDATATGEQGALLTLTAQTVGGAELLMREDGRLLVSAGDDGVIRLWGVPAAVEGQTTD